ncbi:unnamed protein product [Acanthoscelides obtectus]|uniref:Putative nuclease HARBI1 n=1 Tax=Acanthoscelides obtectus TaxID=200917 RepID=A0A9P0PK27_ACAOB|nr:unnamed protein product [Acanthoscelides obtectus]CAK1680823.1 Putative nuclease HARBI1 [Acanthoscelides obtectus]
MSSKWNHAKKFLTAEYLLHTILVRVQPTLYQPCHQTKISSLAQWLPGQRICQVEVQIRNGALSPMNQLLLCLRFYATDCTQLTAADFSGVSDTTANRIIHRVTAAIASLFRQFIYFPRTEAEIQQTQRDFYVIARFPKVIGAVDCTHTKIRSPGGDHAEYYRNRKSFMSISCQGICNANLEFTDVVARWPGSTHDQTIFDNSLQRARFENNEYGDSILLCGSAYASKKYLMTPLANPARPEEILYNESQIRSRNPIERIFGVWKRRFPILALGINTRLDNALPIIIGTAVLYNILKRGGDPLPPDDNELQLPVPWDALIDQGRIDNPLIPNEHGHGADPYR